MKATLRDLVSLKVAFTNFRIRGAGELERKSVNATLRAKDAVNVAFTANTETRKDPLPGRRERVLAWGPQSTATGSVRSGATRVTVVGSSCGTGSRCRRCRPGASPSGSIAWHAHASSANPAKR